MHFITDHCQKVEGRIIHALQLCDPHFNPSVNHPAGFCIIGCKGTIWAEANGHKAILSNTFANYIVLACLYPHKRKGTVVYSFSFGGSVTGNSEAVLDFRYKFSFLLIIASDGIKITHYFTKK